MKVFQEWNKINQKLFVYDLCYLMLLQKWLNVESAERLELSKTNDKNDSF